MSLCTNKSSYFYKSTLCETVRWFKTAKLTNIILTIVAFIVGMSLFFSGLNQDRTFSSYIPTGYFYTIFDIVAILFIIILTIILQRKDYTETNKYGEKTWVYRQSTKRRKILRFLKNILIITLGTLMFYYWIGSFASMFPQQYTYKTYTIKVTSLFNRGHKGCRRHIKTDFLNQLNLEDPSLFVYFSKKFDLQKFCMNYSTYNAMHKNKSITIKTQESQIWGIYVKSLD